MNLWFLVANNSVQDKCVRGKVGPPSLPTPFVLSLSLGPVALHTLDVCIGESAAHIEA